MVALKLSPAARRLAMVLVVLLCGTAQLAAALVLDDPFLARFQVGEYRDPDAIKLDGEWPADILDPLALDPAWVSAAAQYFSSGQIPNNDPFVAWRLVTPALGTVPAVNAFHGQAHASWRQLSELSSGQIPTQPLPPLSAPWAREIRMLRASLLWQQGRHAEAAAAAEELVGNAHTLGLPSQVAFIWELRARRLAHLAGTTVEIPGFPAHLLKLGPYDKRAGWAIWVASCRQAERPVFPYHSVDRDLAVFLAGAGKLYVTPHEFHAAGFDAEIEAGLGALLLPKSELTEHFKMYPEVPVDGRFQGYWLRGQRRLDPRAENLEKLARLPGLKDGHRLDAWRRASESRLLAGSWVAGLDDLEEGLELMGSDASSSMQRRMRQWHGQALALAVAQEKTDAVIRLESLAMVYKGDQSIAWRSETEALNARIQNTRPDMSTAIRQGAEDAVRAGKSPTLTADGLALPDPDSWRHILWGIWAEWGLLLAEDFDAELQAKASLQEYRAGLLAVAEVDEPRLRHTTACAVAARHLRGNGAVNDLLMFAMEIDLNRQSNGACLPAPTPIPRYSRKVPDRTLTARYKRHALLGVALALDDARGQIAAAVNLPSRGLPERDRLLMIYPVPADPAVRSVLDRLELPPEILLAIARNESLFEPAVRSRAGALGYMQIMPFHYKNPAGPPGPDHWSHPSASLRAGARILASETKRFDGDPYRSVAAYNAGRGAVNRWDKQLAVPVDPDIFLAWIGYPETRGYTRRVLRDRVVYRSLLEPGS